MLNVSLTTLTDAEQLLNDPRTIPRVHEPIQNDNSNRAFGSLRGSRRKFSKNFCINRSFVRLLVRSKIFQILVRADAIDLVQKSSNFEPSSRFFGRLKILNSKRRRNEAFEFDSSCGAPQRAPQLESNSNATAKIRRRNEAFEFDSNYQAPQRTWQFESNSNAKV